VGLGVAVVVGVLVGVAVLVGAVVAVGNDVALGAGIGIGADTGAQADKIRLTSKNTTNVRFILRVLLSAVKPPNGRLRRSSGAGKTPSPTKTFAGSRRIPSAAKPLSLQRC
jgi:hypothetical protein